MRLLLIEDDEADRIALKRALRRDRSDLEILEAATAADGVRLLEEQTFDAVFLDHGLPDQNGLELLRQLPDAIKATTSVIMLTGLENLTLASRCFEAGAQDFLLKDEVSQRHLLRAVNLAQERRTMAMALAESDAAAARATTEWNKALSQVSDAIYLVDSDRRLLRANPAFFQLFDCDPQESLGKPIRELLYPGGTSPARCLFCGDDTGMDSPLILEADDPGNPLDIPLELTIQPINNDEGDLTSSLICLHDLVRTRQTEERLRLLAGVFDNTAQGVVITGSDATIIEVNRSFTTILGYERDEVIGGNPRRWKSGRHDKDFYDEMWSALQNTGSWSGEIWNRHKNGEILPVWQSINAIFDENNRITHFTSVFSDISDLKRSQEQLDHLAHHDILTDLPNRLLLKERLEQAIRHARRRNTLLAVIFLDVDNFKHINDSLGHPAGDRLMQEMAKTLVHATRDGDTVARLGGDEFALLLEDVDKPESAGIAAQKVQSALSAPVTIAGREIRPTASLGISLYPQDGETPSTLLRNADSAMYQAKENGRNKFCFYTRELTHEAFERMLLEHNLRHAVEHDEFHLVYQPQYDITENRIVGVEALVRWQHPQEGMISPGRFIPVAEQSDLIHEIGNWVLHAACNQAREWLDRGIDFGRIAVNVGGPQVERGRLVEEVEIELSQSGIPASCLELEVTETFIMRQIDDIISQLMELRELGVTLSVDDFGTGYSSLRYLKELPIDKLKIDQSFVRDIPGNPDDEAIVKTIIAMTASLKLGAVAEGIEREEQIEFLRRHNCRFGQGFLMSHPLAPEEVERLMLPAGADVRPVPQSVAGG